MAICPPVGQRCASISVRLSVDTERVWSWVRILVQVTIYRRLRIGRDGSSRTIRSLRYLVTCTRTRALMLFLIPAHTITGACEVPNVLFFIASWEFFLPDLSRWIQDTSLMLDQRLPFWSSVKPVVCVHGDSVVINRNEEAPEADNKSVAREH